MTIRKGGEWGELCDPPTHIPRFTSARDLGRILEQGDTAHLGRPPFSCFVHNENFMDLLGVKGARYGRCLRAPVDLLIVETLVGGVTRHFVAVEQVRLASRLSNGAVVLISNTGIWRRRRFAPRAHPNDGRIDILTVDDDMSLRQRVLAYRRARLGNHLPHPQLHLEQSATFAWRGSPLSCWIDGERIGSVSALNVRVAPDAAVLYF